MGSLTDLNNYSEGTVAIIDQREPGPKFNFDDPQDDLTQIATTGSIEIYRDQLEILDVVRPDIAELEFIVDVSGVAGVTVDFPDILEDLVEEINGVYTLRYITQKSDWDLAKTATIEIPNTFQGSFFYEVKLRWFDGTTIQELSWEVGQFVPVSNFSSSFGFSIENQYVRLGTAQLPVISTLTQVDEYAQIIGVFSLSVTAEDLDLASSNLNSAFGLTFPVYNPLQGFDNLTFRANQKNNNFFENANIVETPLGTGIDAYQVAIFTSDQSEFYNDNNVEIISWQGNLTQITNVLRSLDYYPVFNNFSPITFEVILQQDNGSTYDVIARERFILNWDGTSAGISTRILEYHGTINPTDDFLTTLEEQKYGEIDICVVGGGGGGALANTESRFGSAGGGGGGVIATTGLSIPPRVIVNAGAGGSVGASGSGSSLAFRTVGGTFLSSYYANGGLAGVQGTNGGGGSSGSPVALTNDRDDYEIAPYQQNGGTYSGSSNETNLQSTTYGRAGGGGGAGGSGGATVTLEPFGDIPERDVFINSIGGKSAKPIWLNNFYGGGGGGGDSGQISFAEYHAGGYQSGGSGAYTGNGGVIVPATLPTSYGGGGGGGFIEYGANYEFQPSTPGAPGAVILRIKPKD